MRKEGYLKKQGGTIKTWKSRYFILDNKSLYYYKDQRSDIPLGLIPLYASHVKRAKEKSTYCFGIEPLVARENVSNPKDANRVYYLVATNEKEMNDWMDTIIQAINLPDTETDRIRRESVLARETSLSMDAVDISDESGINLSAINEDMEVVGESYASESVFDKHLSSIRGDQDDGTRRQSAVDLLEERVSRSSISATDRNLLMKKIKNVGKHLSAWHQAKEREHVQEALVEKEGLMAKLHKGPRGGGIWQFRWVQLKGGRLCYYSPLYWKTRDQNEMHSMISLADCEVIKLDRVDVDPDNNTPVEFADACAEYKFGIMLRNPRKSVCLCARNARRQQSWLQAIQDAIAVENRVAVTLETKVGTLEQLVEQLADEATIDNTFIDTFLMTYRSFTTPQTLFKSLLDRYNNTDGSHESGMPPKLWRKMVLIPRQQHVCSIITQWVTYFYYDFEENEDLHTDCWKFVDVLNADGYENLAGTLAETITTMEKQSAQDGSKKQHLLDAPEPKLPKNLRDPNLGLMDVDSLELARQLCLMELKYFKAIKPYELLNQAWNKEKYKHIARNVLTFINNFNDVSSAISSVIVSEPKIKDRVEVFTKCIQLASHLMQLGDFNAVKAVLAGLSNAAVHRLKHTKSDVPKKFLQTYEELERVMDSDKSHKKYRALLKDAKPPCVPFLGVYLTDLTFIEEGNPDSINDMINFTKRRMIYNVIADIVEYKKHSYNLQEIPQVQAVFGRLPRLTDDEMYSLSLKIEPRGKEHDEIE
eukprot:Rmarinus@m.3459